MEKDILLIMEQFFKEASEKIDPFNPKPKQYPITEIEPTEKKIDPELHPEFKLLKDELMNLNHRIHSAWMDYHMSEVDTDVKKQWEQLKNTNIQDLPDDIKKKYIQFTSAIYNIFRKYLGWKKTEKTKEVAREKEKLSLGTIKSLISQGLSLGEIAEKYSMPKSTLAYKLRHLFQTSYSDIKKSMGK